MAPDLGRGSGIFGEYPTACVEELPVWFSTWHQAAKDHVVGRILI